MTEGRRGQNVRMMALRAVVFLLLGAIVNVAVAWGFAARVSLSSPLKVKVERSDVPEFIDPLWGKTLSGHARVREVTTNLLQECGFGIRRDLWMLGDLEADAIRQPVFTRRVYVLWAGWPYRALRWERYESVGGDMRRRGVRRIVIGGQERLMPELPIWPGFAINTFFYAAILWLLFAAPGTVRRWRRSKRGLCPRCAYPVGASEICTECGAAVKPRTAQT